MTNKKRKKTDRDGLESKVFCIWSQKEMVNSVPGLTQQSQGSVSNTSALNTAAHWQLASKILTTDLNNTIDTIAGFELFIIQTNQFLINSGHK